jgi:hypothetical protein
VSAAAAPARRRGPGTARALRWLLGLQVLIALLLMGGDLLRVVPDLLHGPSRAPGPETPVSPGDQTRRYAPRQLPGPGHPGFPAGDVPARLTWTPTELDGAPALLLTGNIRPGDGARLIEHLDALTEPPATVALHSPGGSVSDALAIGRRLREHGVATRVADGAACFSACPYILAGGTERRVSRGAMVSVHQHYFGESTVLPAFLAVEDIQRGQAEVLDYLDAMGIDPMLVAKAMHTPPQEIYVLVEPELEEFALATAITD